MGLNRNTGSLKVRPNRAGSVKRSGSADGLGSTTTLDSSSFGSLPDLGTDHSEDVGSVSVVVRVRPLNEKEVQQADESIIQVQGSDQVVVRPDLSANLNQTQSSFNQTLAPKSFTFNSAADQTSSQAELFQKSGIMKIIELALDGFSTTVFCYGQTGSGKTHTLTGPPHLFHDRPDPFSEDHGLVYRSFVYLFDRLREKSEFSYVLKASFLEIYNEKVIDLLNPGTYKKPLQVRWSRKLGGFYVENLFTVECEEFDDLLAVLEEGMKNRAVGSHSMNEYSSRSHTILTVHVVSEMKASEDGVYLSRHGKINFVDLAGSEMTKKTNSQGKTLEEANNINKSLMVLGYCISQLSDPRKKSTHIPYRDSKLTQLLSDSLAGNGVTLMIACISPARSNLSETLNTLRYAARAKHIRNKPVVVMDPREALILSLKREVGALQEENAHLRNLVDFGQTLQMRRDADAFDGVPNTPRLSDLPPPEQQQLLHSLMMENRALRRENADLYALREALLRQQEAVTKHNEKLIKQIEGNPIPRVQTPFAGKRSVRSTEAAGSPLQRSNSLASLSVEATAINPLSQSFTLQRHSVLLNSDAQMPPTVSRELTKRGFTRSGNSNDPSNARTSSSTSSSSSSGAPARRKKLTDLKVDLNFVPAKGNSNNNKNSTGNPGVKKISPAARQAK